MRQRDFSGHRTGAASGQSRRGNRVMRGAERAAVHHWFFIGKQACHRVNSSGFDCFLKAEFRQNGGQALCKHTFSGSGRSDEKKIMPACRSNFQRALSKSLSPNVLEVSIKVIGTFQNQHRVEGKRLNQRFVALQMLHQLGNVPNGINL